MRPLTIQRVEVSRRSEEVSSATSHHPKSARGQSGSCEKRSMDRMAGSKRVRGAAPSRLGGGPAAAANSPLTCPSCFMTSTRCSDTPIATRQPYWPPPECT